MLIAILLTLVYLGLVASEIFGDQSRDDKFGGI